MQSVEGEKEGVRMCAGRYRVTSLIRNTPLLGLYSRTIPRVLWWSWGGGAVSYERGTPVLPVVPNVATRG